MIVLLHCKPPVSKYISLIKLNMGNTISQSDNLFNAYKWQFFIGDVKRKKEKA